MHPIRDVRSRRTLMSVLLSNIGIGVYVLALGQMLYKITGSPEGFALILAIQGVGSLCVLPFSGPLVDMLSSRMVYVACGLFRAATVLAIIAVFAMDLPHPVLLIGMFSFLLAAYDSVQRAALFKFTAFHITGGFGVRLNSLLGVSIQTGRLVGMGIIGLVLIVGSPAQALSIDVAVSVLSVIAIGRGRLTAVEPGGAVTRMWLRTALPNMVSQWGKLMRAHRSEPGVFLMVVLCAGDFVFACSLSTLVIPLVQEQYAGQTWYISAFEGTYALGIILGAFVVRYTVKQRLFPVWIAIQVMVAVAMFTSSLLVVHVASFLIAGFATLNSLTWLVTSLQRQAGDQDKAKMASLRMFAIGLGTAALLPVIGHFAKISLTQAYGVLALIMAAFAACGVWVSLRFRPNWETPVQTPLQDQISVQPEMERVA